MKLKDYIKNKLGIQSLFEHQKEVSARLQQLEDIFLTQEEVINSVQQMQKQLQEDVLELEMELSEVKTMQEKMQSNNISLEQKIQNTDKWLKDTREKLWENTQNLNGRIQSTDGWVKDTREKLVLTNEKIESSIKDTREKFVLANEKIESSIKDTREKFVLTNEKIESSIKDIREKVWDMSKKVSDLNKEQWSQKFQMRKLEYQQKRYLPADKYDKAIEDWYFDKTGRTLDITNPKTFNEIMQWAKLYENTEEKSRLSDKYAVRKWVKEKIGEQYLIPLLGVYEKAEDIDFEALPQQFVLKCNHGSGYNIVVEDKSKINEAEIRDKLNKWLHEEFAFTHGFELHYMRIKPCIVIEKYIRPEWMEDLLDYKFYCFGGKVFCSYTRVPCMESHSEDKVGFCDRAYNLLPYHRVEFKPITEQIEKPLNYDKMVELAEILAEGFSHVRVDFYNINGTIYFGEMTFTTASGTGFFEPEEFDRILGEEWLKYLPELH